MDKSFEKSTFGKRMKTMLCVDLRRMFTTWLIYLLIGACLVIPIVILVMTTMMDGQESVNQQTGEVTVIEGFDNVWQIIGTASKSADEGAGAMEMDMISMCNINLLYFALSALVCFFVCGDFKSGYAKNLFTVRASKLEYTVSKTLVCFLGGALMIIAFIVGSLIGGAIMNLPFDPTEIGASFGGVAFCILSKILLVGVFVPIYVLISVIIKQKPWLAVLGSAVVGMLLFTMIPMITPLDSTYINVVLCIVGALIASVGLGAVSTVVLKKTSLV